jgi:DNA-binding transcriptional MocR family regulator
MVTHCRTHMDDSTHGIVAAVDDRSPQGIAAAISRLVSSDRLVAGTRLPTVRELARALGTSPGTVSGAWQALAGLGVIESRGRLGTFVRAHPRGSHRYAQIRASAPSGAAGGRVPGFRLDLSTGTPDPLLLPDLGPALARVGGSAHTTSYQDDPVHPALAAHLAATWPFAAEALTIVDGALDALDRVAAQVVRFGDRVLVENPTFPGLLDILEHRGAVVVPLETDGLGVVPDAVRAVLDSLDAAPAALFLQPRAQNPTGASMTAARARALARVLRGRDVVVVEDDHSGDIAQAADVSVGRHLAGACVHIRSYSKSHGPDLRVAAVGGPSRVVDPLVARRQLGPGWTSRLLQGVLVDLLRDPGATAVVGAARDAYAARRDALRAALAARDVASSPGDGVNLWVSVADERAALVTLAAAGIRVSPGTPFVPAPLATDHVRVTTALLRDGVEEVAEHLAAAAASPYGPNPSR